MTKEKIGKVYIDIASLLDMRLGTLTVMDPDFAFDVAHNPVYYQREEDVFASAAMGTLSKESYAKVHEKARAKIIRNSLRTRMFDFARDLVMRLFIETVNTPQQSRVEIDVNLYPYVLEDEEMVILSETISHLLGGEFTVNIINVSNAQLQVETVRESYRAMIMYNYHEWFNLYDKEIKKTPLRDLTLFVPRLYLGYLPGDKELEEFTKVNTDPFQFLERILAPLCLIQHLPIALFCAATPENLDKYSRPEPKVKAETA